MVGDYEISSEIYSEYSYITAEKPKLDKNNVISRFQFTYPPEKPEPDNDGDLIVQRKGKSSQKIGLIQIEHSRSTVLDLVGFQIWRGALLLADWLLFNGNKLPENSTILEVGSGVGFTSIVASIFRPVICTDVDRGDLLNLIRHNVSLNKGVVKCPVEVMELDFQQPSLRVEMLQKLAQVKIVIAADVIYDDRITDAFIKTVQNLLSVPPKRDIYVALEKRYVFTVADLNTVAPCHDYFMQQLKKLKSVTCEEVELDFPQYFQYDRVKELVLLKISSNKNHRKH